MRDTRMSLASFERLAARGNLVPVWRELPGDTETPVSAFLKLPTPSHAFLLESVQGGERWGRYSFLGDEPIALVRQGPDGVVLEQAGGRTFDDQLPPLDALRELMDPFDFVRPDGAPPFVGGLVGYLGHGAVRWFEPRVPQRHGPDPDFPDGEWMLVDRCAVFDNLSHRLRIWASVHLPLYPSVEGAYAAAMARADTLAEALQRPLPAPGPAPTLGGLEDGWERAGLRGRGRARPRVHRRRRLLPGGALPPPLGRLPGRPVRAVPRAPPRLPHPVPLLPPASATGPWPAPRPSCSSASRARRSPSGPSPVRASAGPRPEEDAALEAELKADPKERAEHVMLVDLGRNDVGRVSRPGTVKVEEREVIERYSHVMHMVSQVSGTLDPGLDAWDVIAASFPAGTVSGAPKVRALEIIDELEPVSRGPYAGAAGYVGFDGDMDLAIVIRSVALSGRRLRFQAGAGIVHDSTPEAEYQETAHKLRAALVAIAGDEAGR